MVRDPGVFSRLLGDVTGDAEALRRAASRMRAIMRALEARLQGAGASATLLDERMLRDELWALVNPVTARTIPPPALPAAPLDAAKADVFYEPTLARSFCPSTIYNDYESLRVDEQLALVRVYRAHHLPPKGKFDTLFDLMFGETHGAHVRIHTTAQIANKTTMKAVMSANSRPILTHARGAGFVGEANQALEEHRAYLDDLSHGGEASVRLRFLAVLTAPNGEVLSRASDTIKKSFAEAGGHLVCPAGHQLKYWSRSLPGNGQASGLLHPTTSSGASRLIPFSEPARGDGTPDFLFETAQNTPIGLSLRNDGHTRENNNAVVSGGTGSGKTMLGLHLAETVLAQAGHAIVVDMKGPTVSTWRVFADAVGGLFIPADPDCAHAGFNPCPSQARARDGQGELDGGFGDLPYLVGLMHAPDDIPSAQRDAIERTVRDAAHLAYTRLAESATVVKLEHIAKGLRVLGTRQAYPRQSLAAQMAAQVRACWVEHPTRGRLLNTERSGVFDNPFCAYDFSGVENDKPLSSVLLSCLQGTARAKLEKLPLTTPKLFVADEAKKLIDSVPHSAALLEAMIRVIRAHKGSVCFISQHVSDLLESSIGPAVSSNAALYFLLRQNSGHERVAKLLRMHPRLRERFEKLKKVAGHYSEALVLDRPRDDAFVARYRPTPYSFWRDTSNPVHAAIRNDCVKRLGLEKALEGLATCHPNGPDEALLAKYSNLLEDAA